MSDGWHDNHGVPPEGLAGKRVEVELNNGVVLGGKAMVNGSPAGSEFIPGVPVPGEGVRGAANFRLRGPFGIKRWRLVGGGS